jgi:hypothetical protein
VRQPAPCYAACAAIGAGDETSGACMKTTVKKGKKVRNKTAKEMLRDTKKAAGSLKRKILGK